MSNDLKSPKASQLEERAARSLVYDNAAGTMLSLAGGMLFVAINSGYNLLSGWLISLSLIIALLSGLLVNHPGLKAEVVDASDLLITWLAVSTFQALLRKWSSSCVL